MITFPIFGSSTTVRPRNLVSSIVSIPVSAANADVYRVQIQFVIQFTNTSLQSSRVTTPSPVVVVFTAYAVLAAVMNTS